MTALRLAGAALLVGCGWCAGDAAQSCLAAHEDALRRCVELLHRIRQEVAYRRADLSCLYEELRREGFALSGESLQSLAPPPALTKDEASCFSECVSGLGRASARQECERLDYYLQRFEEYLRAAQGRTQSGAALTRRLGLAAGAVAALLFI